MNVDNLRLLRNAFSSFITGVTVVTTCEKNGTPRGFTANSFASVSLDPPLVLVCISNAADSYPVFTAANRFAINILTENQVEISGLFASKRADKFDQARWKSGAAGLPILEDVCAWFECDLDSIHHAGDHTILVGRVQTFDYNDSTGLGFVRGGYVNLRLEQEVLEAASSSVGAVVGAIVEYNGKVMLVRDPDSNKWRLPVSGLDGNPGSVKNLLNLLSGFGVNATIASLYAVFENDQDGGQFIYYRAFSDSGGADELFWSQEDLPWNALASTAIQSMLHRYFDEKKDQRFGIYFGDNEAGAVKIISDH